MRRRLALLAGLLAFLGAEQLSFTQGTRHRRPLDLPSGGVGSQHDDEDAPEIIQFLGGLYEGDGFFFLLDISGSMHGDKIDLLKEELAESLAGLSSRSEFGIVAFSDFVVSFSRRPRRGTPLQKEAARQWVMGLEAAGSTYMLDGARVLLPIAHQSRRRHKVIIAVGDGLPTKPPPDETLVGILEQNIRHLPWNTILLGSSTHALKFMTTLAESTGGSFRHREF